MYTEAATAAAVMACVMAIQIFGLLISVGHRALARSKQNYTKRYFLLAVPSFPSFFPFLFSSAATTDDSIRSYEVRTHQSFTSLSQTVWTLRLAQRKYTWMQTSDRIENVILCILTVKVSDKSRKGGSRVDNGKQNHSMWMTFFRMNKSTESGETSAHLPNDVSLSIETRADSCTCACVRCIRICVCTNAVSSWKHSSEWGRLGWKSHRANAMHCAGQFACGLSEWMAHDRPILFSFYTVFNIKRHSSAVSTCRMCRIRTFIEIQIHQHGRAGERATGRPSPGHRITHTFKCQIRSIISPNGKSSYSFRPNKQWFSMAASKRKRRGLSRNMSTLASNIGENGFCADVLDECVYSAGTTTHTTTHSLYTHEHSNTLNSTL